MKAKLSFFLDRKATGIIKLQVQLPKDLLCDHCVFQWKYNTGHSWGSDPITGKAGIGLGTQEQFYGCSDIQISSKLRGNSLADKLPEPNLDTNNQITIIKEKEKIDIFEEKDVKNKEINKCESYEEVFEEVVEYLNKILRKLNKLKENNKDKVKSIEPMSNFGYSYAARKKTLSNGTINNIPKEQVKKIQYPIFSN